MVQVQPFSAEWSWQPEGLNFGNASLAFEPAIHGIPLSILGYIYLFTERERKEKWGLINKTYPSQEEYGMGLQVTEYLKIFTVGNPLLLSFCKMGQEHLKIPPRWRSTRWDWLGSRMITFSIAVPFGRRLGIEAILVDIILRLIIKMRLKNCRLVPPSPNQDQSYNSHLKRGS